MKVLFVGQSLPENAAPDAEPLDDSTLTGRRLQRWLKQLLRDGDDYVFLNACEKPGSTKASFDEVRSLHDVATELQPDRIVALGKVAKRALERGGIRCWELPHPSGRNLQMNDVRKVQLLLEECRDWIQSTGRFK